MKNSIDDSWPKIRAVLEAGPARGMFRSWYSIVPIHKSFFKAYALAFAFCLIVLAWMWMNINAVLGAEPAPAATNYPALVKADPSWGKVTLREPTPSRLDGCHAERVHLTAEDPIFHGEGETVFDDYVPDTTPVGTVLIVPPTGGENVIDRLYARVLCKHGIAAALVKHWPNDTIGGRDVRVHDQYFLGAVVALKRVRHAVQAARGGQVGVLGTSLGSLASLQLLENDSQIQSGVLIVSGAPLSKILATSDLKQLVAQRADRYQAWGITTPEEYERRLAAEIQLDTAKLSPGLRSKNLLQYIGLKDTTVPTETQLTLWEAAGHPPGDRYESNHVPTVEKTFWHHREDIAQFFLKAFRN